MQLQRGDTSVEQALGLSEPGLAEVGRLQDARGRPIIESAGVHDLEACRGSGILQRPSLQNCTPACPKESKMPSLQASRWQESVLPSFL